MTKNLLSFRSEFSHLDTDLLYLDHAAVSPLNDRSRKKMEQYLKERSESPVNNYMETMRLMGDCRERFARLIQAPVSRIASVKNTTDGFLLLARGYPWKKGDRIILHRREFPSNVYPWYDLKPFGVEIDFLDTPLGRVTPEDLESVVTDRTVLVSLSWVQYLSGFRNSLKPLSDWCHERGIILAVDAMQGLGALGFDQEEWDIDFIASGTAKWLMGIQGIGFIYISEKLQEKIHPPHLGWQSRQSFFDFHNYDQPLKANADRYEFATPASPGVWGTHEALGLLLDAGRDEIETRILHLTDILATRLQESGFSVYSDRSRPAVKSGIVTFSWKDKSRNKILHDVLHRKNIIISYREGYLRVSPHFYNSEAELLRFIDVLNLCCKELESES